MAKIININAAQRLGMTNSLQKGGKKMPLSECLKIMVNDLEQEINNRVLDVGYFGNFSVNIGKKNPEFWGKDIALFVEQDTKHEGEAFLGVSVLHPTLPVERPVYLAKGDRKKLIEFIKKEGFDETLLKTVNGLSESLQIAPFTPY